VERLGGDDDEAAARELLNEAIVEGQTYPQLEVLDAAGFRAYFLSHEAFVCRVAGAVVGAFYVKPNFPGRCAHICNGGFVVARPARGNGVARAMARVFLRVARALGYRAVMFNLVFESNTPSVRLWDSLGFARSGRVPQAGLLAGLGYVDAIQFYKDLCGRVVGNAQRLY
jgi:L-amino acid N-acyltransferase YncA